MAPKPITRGSKRDRDGSAADNEDRLEGGESPCTKRIRVNPESDEALSNGSVPVQEQPEPMEVEMCEATLEEVATAPSVAINTVSQPAVVETTRNKPEPSTVNENNMHRRDPSQGFIDIREVASRSRQLPASTEVSAKSIVAPNPPPPTPNVKSPVPSSVSSTESYHHGSKEAKLTNGQTTVVQNPDFTQHDVSWWKDSMRFFVVIFEMLVSTVFKAQERPLRNSHTAMIPQKRRPFLVILVVTELLFVLLHRPLRINQLILLILVPVIVSALPNATALRQAWLGVRGSRKSKPVDRIFPHVVPPLHKSDSSSKTNALTDFTLRDFLLQDDGFHLCMAPAFFGFYAYFGALAAWDEHVLSHDGGAKSCLKTKIKSVAGASAGAMAAVLLSVGIPPRRAAEFCGTVTLGRFADPPGIAAVFRGHKFEALMESFMKQEKPDHSLRLEDGEIPVAVSAFNVRKLKGELLSRGSMAKAARASATFPFLFQPVRWKTETNERSAWFIDGGVTDYLGIHGLAAFTSEGPKRVVNLVVGDFPSFCPPGPSSIPAGIDTSEVLSISIRSTPRCGPWAMKNGPRAMEAARKVMVASLDLPLYKGQVDGHYELHLDASSFVPSSA